jgi:hypothetical protein
MTPAISGLGNNDPAQDHPGTLLERLLGSGTLGLIL